MTPSWILLGLLTIALGLYWMNERPRNPVVWALSFVQIGAGVVVVASGVIA